MAITTETLRLARQMRREVSHSVDGVTRTLTAAWAEAWALVRADWEAALDDLIAASENGRWPSQQVVRRMRRAQLALETTEKTIRELSDQAARIVTVSTPKVVADAANWEARLIASGMPKEAAVTAVSFQRVDPTALEAIVARTTQQITALSWPISTEATAAIQAELIRGINLGNNPRRAASLMVRRVEGRFAGGLARANNVARTEMLDAHRAAARAQDLANLDVVEGWEWMATLDRRTCPSCLAQHGSVHQPDEVGPLDHQQGRCARVPAVKSWRDLGFDLDEPDSAMPSAREWYDGLSKEEQQGIMGPTRQQLLADGKIGWDDLSARRSTAGWRDSFTPTPISSLEER